LVGWPLLAQVRSPVDGVARSSVVAKASVARFFL
jgi:hypothetical protein